MEINRLGILYMLYIKQIPNRDLLYSTEIMTQLVKNPSAMQETPVNSLVRNICWRRNRLPTPVFLGFPRGQLVKNLPAMWETWVQSLGWEDLLEKGKVIPTPAFWPGEFHGLYSLRDCKESDTTERPSLSLRWSYVRLTKEQIICEHPDTLKLLTIRWNHSQKLLFLVHTYSGK